MISESYEAQGKNRVKFVEKSIITLDWKMDSLLCLDTSGSMSGTKIEELKKAVLTFIQFAEQVDIGGYIGKYLFN